MVKMNSEARAGHKARILRIVISYNRNWSNHVDYTNGVTSGAHKMSLNLEKFFRMMSRKNGFIKIHRKRHSDERRKVLTIKGVSL